MSQPAASLHWGREIGCLGHNIRLIPPVYVKPFVKRKKNDANDADAIAETASRHAIRNVSIKSAEQQAQGMAFWTRDLFVRQPPRLVNPLWGHLAEYGVVVGQGMVQFRRMIASFDERTETAYADGNCFSKQTCTYCLGVSNEERELSNSIAGCINCTLYVGKNRR